MRTIINRVRVTEDLLSNKLSKAYEGYYKHENLNATNPDTAFLNSFELLCEIIAEYPRDVREKVREAIKGVPLKSKSLITNLTLSRFIGLGDVIDRLSKDELRYYLTPDLILNDLKTGANSIENIMGALYSLIAILKEETCGTFYTYLKFIHEYDYCKDLITSNEVYLTKESTGHLIKLLKLSSVPKSVPQILNLKELHPYKSCEEIEFYYDEEFYFKVCELRLYTEVDLTVHPDSVRMQTDAYLSNLNKFLYIGLLSIEEAFRQKGLFKQLMSLAENRAKELGLERLVILAYPVEIKRASGKEFMSKLKGRQDRLVSIYKKYGFKETLNIKSNTSFLPIIYMEKELSYNGKLSQNLTPQSQRLL